MIAGGGGLESRGDGAAGGMDVYGRLPSGVVGGGVGRELGVSSLGTRKSALDDDVESDQSGRGGGEDDTRRCMRSDHGLLFNHSLWVRKRWKVFCQRMK